MLKSSPTETNCHSQLTRRFLEAGLSPEELADLEVQLGTCETCQIGSFLSDPQYHVRMIREARTIATLRDPHIGLILLAAATYMIFASIRHSPAHGGIAAKTDAGSQNERVQRYGPLDDLDRIVVVAELKQGINQLVWLRRMANLSVDEIPSEVIPWVAALSEQDNPSIRELAQVILNKNPFQEISDWTTTKEDLPPGIEDGSDPPSQIDIDSPENPFVEITQDEN